MSILLLSSLALNIISSVGVIFINKKLVFGVAGFHFGTALTIIHFVVTFLGCLMFGYLKFFDPKKLPIQSVLSISLAFCGYVAFNNLALLHNSVTIYQISKILCTPVIVGIEIFHLGKRHSWETLLSLVPVCMGIFITVYADTEINWVGSFWALCAVVANSLYTIWGKTKQTELQVTPMQILYYQAPVSAVILTITLPAMDPFSDLVQYNMTSSALMIIGLSCIFAFGVNFSFFLFVGQTSSLTMNVVGYLKTCLVFVGGFLLFDAPLTWQNMAGIALTLVGLALYSKAQLMPYGGSGGSSSSSVASKGVSGGGVSGGVSQGAVTAVVNVAGGGDDHKGDDDDNKHQKS